MSLFKNTIQRGTRAAQPVATAVVIGTLYFVTDEQVTERSNGTTWQTFSQVGAGTGDVVGPSSSVASEVALYDGTTGKLIKRATGTGVAHLTSGVLSLSNVLESEITLADNTTNNVGTAAHGFAPKAPGDATKFLNGANPPAWAVPAGGTILIEERTAAASSSLDFTTRNKNGYTGATFQSDFDEYEFHIVSLIPATNGAGIYLRFSTDGGSTFDATAAHYSWSIMLNVGDGSPSNVAFSSTSATEIKVHDNQGNAAKLSMSGRLEVFNPLSTALYKLVSGRFNVTDSTRTTSSLASLLGAKWLVDGTAGNALRFIASSGNLTSGVIRCYGVSK